MFLTDRQAKRMRKVGRERFVAWAATGGLLMAMLLAGTISLATAPSSGHEFLQSGPEAAAELATAVRATMALPSFTVTARQVALPLAVMVYQSPDRLSQQVDDYRHIIVGRIEYCYNAPLSKKWFEQPVPSLDLTNWNTAMKVLTETLESKDVSRDGDTFTTVVGNHTGRRQPIAIPHTSAIVTTLVRNGLVYAQKVNTFSGISLLSQTYEYEYSRMGTSPPVTLPRGSDVTGQFPSWEWSC